MSNNEYYLTTADLAAEFGIDSKTVRAKAAPLGLGIDFGGRKGYLYSDQDRRRLIESLKPAAATTPTRKRRRAA